MSVFKKAMAEDPEESLSLAKNSRHSNINHMLDRLNHQSSQKVFDSSTKALLQDPSNLDPFGYDSYYEKITSQRKAAEAFKKKDKSKPKYIEALMDAAEKRKRERSIVYEKLAENELKKEGNDSKGERYITESYKQVLEANKKFLKEDDEKEKFNDKHGITGKQDLSAIYRTMFRENVFHGGDRIVVETNELKTRKENDAKNRSRSRSKEKMGDKGKTQEDRLQKQNEGGRNVKKENVIEEGKTVQDEKNTEKRGDSNIEMPKQEKSLPINKDEKLMSARERYLARKLNLEANTLEAPGNDNNNKNRNI